jgi:four helix bundle protein
MKGKQDMKNTKIKKFEDLDIYKKAREVTNKIYELTRDNSFSKDYGLRDQIRRASVSIMSNISEGFERGSNTEFIQFLFIAKASCGEVRAQLLIASDQKYIKDYDYLSLANKCIEISRMISGLISCLKKSKYSGFKFKL